MEEAPTDDTEIGDVNGVILTGDNLKKSQERRRRKENLVDNLHWGHNKPEDEAEDDESEDMLGFLLEYLEETIKTEAVEKVDCPELTDRIGRTQTKQTRISDWLKPVENEADESEEMLELLIEYLEEAIKMEAVDTPKLLDRIGKNPLKQTKISEWLRAPETKPENEVLPEYEVEKGTNPNVPEMSRNVSKGKGERAT